MLVSMVFQALYVLVDLFWVGRLGTDAVAAVGISADAAMQTLTEEYLLWFIPAMALQFAIVAMGAAVATFVAVAVGVIWISFYFADRDACLRFHCSDWKPEFRVWGQMLKIGLPAGVEFGLMGVYMVVVYAISRRFGAAAQAGFGVGFRFVQSVFLPIVALGFAVAPVAGQNFGAKQGDRVREVFKTAASIAAAFMLQVGVDYLHIVTLNFVASGITFVSASMFQGMGNTLPSLATSFLRIIVGIAPAVVLSGRPEFALTWIWWFTVVSTTLQMALNLVLLQREFRIKLAGAALLSS
ncbi:MAG: hypothetical protein EXQ51_02360 [Acidobacteria bacterium]|nr:hypothetical protein [Acidobacteriota bacterium]